MATTSDERRVPQPAPFPARVGSYDLLLPIASGGMGTVFLARKRGPGGFEREVALKLTHTFLREQPEFAAQLIEEAKIASRIQHPNVVQVLDVEDDPFGVFLVMQYVEGDTLGGLIQHARQREERVPVEVALRVLVDALAGLHAAHELRDKEGQPLGLVHRDFTPQNILVGMDGVARLTDFGVAKAASRAPGTRTGVVKGKTAYMAPEQVRAQPLDRRTDVWAAGIVAWELFAGRRMHEATEDPTALLLQIATETPPRLRTVRPEVPPAVDEAVARALAPDRTRRCPTAAQLSDLLVAAWAGLATPAEPANVAEHVRAVVGDTIAQRRERVLTGAMLPRPPAVDAQSIPRSPAQETESSLVTPARSVGAARSRVRSWAIAGTLVVAGASAYAVLGHAPRHEPVIPATALPAVAPPAPPHGGSLHLTANLPISEVRVEGSVIALASPATSLVVELPPDVVHTGATVEAASSDGRRTAATLGADASQLVLSFPDLPPPSPSSIAAPTPTHRRVPRPSHAPRPPASGDTPLAKSPYE